MSKTLTRLLVAASISALSFLATFAWYKSTQISSKNMKPPSEKAIAVVDKIYDVTQRRAVTRVMWQALSPGDGLYPGEAVRTSPDGEARIQFVEGDRFLDVEADSVIVLSKSEGEIALDLLEGGIFVTARETPNAGQTQQLVLNSASGKINLSQATARISGSSKKQLDVQVLSGKATIEAKGKTQTLTKGSAVELSAKGPTEMKARIEMVLPLLDTPIYQTTTEPEDVIFKWTGVEPKTKVRFERGDSRKDLTEMLVKRKDGANEFATQLRAGKNYWRVIALNEDGTTMASTPVYKTEVIVRNAPQLITPKLAQKFIMNPPAALPVPAPAEANQTTPSPSPPPRIEPIQVTWSAAETFHKILLEIAQDSEFTQQVFSSPFVEEKQHSFTPQTIGKYYVRLSGYLVGDLKPLVSKISFFEVVENAPPPPAPIATPAPPPPPEVRLFWTNLKELGTQYFVQNPELKVQWAGTPPQFIKNWKLRMAPVGESLAGVKPVSFPAHQMQFVQKIPKAGRYVASIEAYDENQKLLAKSKLQEFESVLRPYILPPEFESKEEVLKADAQGALNVNWLPAAGAQKYKVLLLDGTGQILKSNFTTEMTAHLDTLMPGQYQIEVLSVDSWGRDSEKVSRKKIEVPDNSLIGAPRLKKVKVN
ncbi:MAG: hypothetical protein AB7O96_17735 [Pseudobdellovibrionaceae bacterium]